MGKCQLTAQGPVEVTRSRQTAIQHGCCYERSKNKVLKKHSSSILGVTYFRVVTLYFRIIIVSFEGEKKKRKIAYRIIEISLECTQSKKCYTPSTWLGGDSGIRKTSYYEKSCSTKEKHLNRLRYFALFPTQYYIHM